MGIVRFSLSSAFFGAAFIGVNGFALADSRIFEARSNAPGVTIEEAFRNGEPLTVVGRGDDSTLFRIDSETTPVGCANRIEFVTSTGQKIEEVADMCALNWAVVVDVQPEEPSPAEPSGTPDLRETVSVVTDPEITILTVTLDGDPISISGRDGKAVQFEVEGGEAGIVCERDVGVILSDGRSFHQNSNLCLSDWAIVIALDGSGQPTPPPPPPAPDSPTAEPAAPVPPKPLPGPVADLQWMFSANEDQAGLVHANVETEASNFLATCVLGSGAITVKLMDAEVPGLTTGSPVPITFKATSFSRTYSGLGSEPSEQTGLALPETEISVSDPLWAIIIGDRTLQATTGPAWGTTISLSGSAEPAKQLLAACSPAPATPQGPNAPPAAGGPGIVASYLCDNGSAITVTFNGALATATVAQAGAPLATLNFEPGHRNARYIGGAGVLAVRGDGQVRWNRANVAATLCRPQ